MPAQQNIFATDSDSDKSLAAGPWGNLPRRPIEFSGAGSIGRITAWIVAILFTVPIFIPGIYQYWYDTTVLKRWEFDDLVMVRPTAEKLSQFEKNLTQQSRFDRWVRHTFWRFYTGGYRPPHGVIVGSDGFLFTEEEPRIFNTYSLTSAAPSPSASIMPAILDFNAQLNRRGIRLILVPIPLKLSIYPEKLLMDYLPSDGMPLPPGYDQWLSQVRQNGIDAIDLNNAFWNAKEKSPRPLFWLTDTHWSLDGRKLGADVIANFLRPLIQGLPRADFAIGTTSIEFQGDLATSLASGYGSKKYPRISYQCAQLTRHGKPFVAGDAAPILLLGDSFTEFWNDDGCGLADELMRRLGVEVQAIGVPADPINQPRLILQQRPQALKSKKLLIWEFDIRYMWGQWQKIPLPPP
jgi:hypothetical protein